MTLLLLNSVTDSIVSTDVTLALLGVDLNAVTQANRK